MDNIKISVIIPVYNTEQYLIKCLETIINQTLKDIEIICVNDGSTDHSLQILYNFSKIDSRIKIITQEKQGVAVARNKGLSVAQGKYLSFLDSDDFFELDMLEQMYICAEKYNTDIVVCKSKKFYNGYIIDNNNIKDSLLPKKEVFSSLDIPNYVFQFHVGWCWDKLYKTSFIKELGISFQNIKKNNDSFFSHISMIMAKRIYVLDKRLVYYRKNREYSISKTKINKDDYIFLCKDFLKEIKQYLVENKIFEIFEQSYINYCMYSLAKHFKCLTFKIQTEFLKIFEIGCYKINYFYSQEYKIVYLVAKYKILIPVYNLYIKIKNILNNIYKRFFKPKKFSFFRKEKRRMIPQKKLEYFCVHIVDHCNLRCQCCDHFSPIAKEWYADLQAFERDLKQFSLLSNQQVERIGLLGGEPLLHPKIAEFAKIARKYFKNSKIAIVSNGLLLLKQNKNFWDTCRQNNIIVAVTKYPINLDYDKMQETAKKYNVVMEFYNNSDKRKKTSYHIPLDLNGKQNSTYNFLRCFHANHLTLLRDGKLYPCSFAPNAFKFNDYFNKTLPMPEGINIYKAKDMNEVLNFISKPINFCKYCYVKRRSFHHTWNRSKKDIKEWTV